MYILYILYIYIYNYIIFPLGLIGGRCGGSQSDGGPPLTCDWNGGSGGGGGQKEEDE